MTCLTTLFTKNVNETFLRQLIYCTCSQHARPASV